MSEWGAKALRRDVDGAAGLCGVCYYTWDDVSASLGEGKYESPQATVYMQPEVILLSEPTEGDHVVDHS